MKSHKKKILTAIAASRLYQLHGDRNAVLKFYRYHPEMLDPQWEDENAGHPDVGHARLLRWQLCRQLGSGELEYRFSGNRGDSASKNKVAKWPSSEIEKSMLARLKGTNPDLQLSLLPLCNPWIVPLSALVPSATRAFRNGNRKCILDLAKIIPGLLMVRRDSECNASSQDKFARYLEAIAEFQSCFLTLLAEGRIRVARTHSHPKGMEERFSTIEKALEAGLDKETVYAVVRYLTKDFANVSTDRSKIKRKGWQKAAEGFSGGERLERELRQQGVIPDKLPLAERMAEWIVVQHWFRRQIKNVVEEINRLPAHALASDKDAANLRMKCQKYMDAGKVLPLPTANEIARAAVRYWPGLGGSAEPAPHATAADLLILFNLAEKKAASSTDMDLYGLFLEIIQCYCIHGLEKACRHL